MIKVSKLWRSLVAATVVAGTVATMLPTPAFAAISAVTFAPANTGTGVASGILTVGFTTGAVVPAGGSIAVTFPTGFTVPTAAAITAAPPVVGGAAGAGIVVTTVTVSGQIVYINSATAQAGAGAVTLAFPAADLFYNPVAASAALAAGGSVGTFAGSNGTGAVTEAAVAGVITPAIGGVVGSQDLVTSVAATPNTPSANASYAVAVTTQSHLTAGVSSIVITFTESTNFAASSGYGLPTTISKSNIVISGTTCDLGAPVGTGAAPVACAGGQISTTQNPPSDPSVDVNAGTITLTVPDMNPGNTAGAGHNLQAGAISIGISANAGITNPTGASLTKRIWVSDSKDNLIPACCTVPANANAAAPLLPRVIQLSTVKNTRGTVVTVNGFGFTTPSVTLFLDNSAAGAGGVNNGALDTGEPTLASGVAVSSGKFTTTITITSAFKSGGANWIQAIDASGTQTAQPGGTKATATNFALDPSILSVTPASGGIGDTLTAQLQDYPAADTALTIKVAGKADSKVSAPAIAADGTASWTFTIPAGVPQGPASVAFASATQSASKTITINGATITVSPTTIVPGQQITISGNGFTGSSDLAKAATPYTGVTIGGTIMSSTALAGGVPIPPDTKADSGGSMIMQFKVPATGAAAITAPGVYTVIVTDNSAGGINGTANITIATPTLSISPTTGLGGSTITFSGSGWAASTSVTITYPATAAANNVTTTVQSDSGGVISGTMTIPVSSNLAIPSTNTITATALTGVETASAVHSVPAATLAVSPTSGAPGSNVTVSGTNFPIFTSVAALTIGGNAIAVTGVNTDAGGTFTTTILIPGLNPGTAAVVATVGTTSANTSITVTTQPTTVSATTAFAALVNTQNLNIVTTQNQATGTYNAYVPNLGGNTLTTVSPNSVIIVTMTKDTTIIVSGVSFSVKANVPWLLPVGAAVTIAVQ